MNLPGGLWVALPTPFDADDGPDLDALSHLVQRLVGGGADVVVPLGTTGEAASLDDDERDEVITICRRAAGDRPMVVGCGHPATHIAARLVQRARALGADGALVATPYYNRPTQEGLVAHYETIATTAPGFPLVAYDVPSRTGVSVALPTLQRLWRVDEVVALKDSCGDVQRYRDIVGTLPAGKALLGGDDSLALAAVASGAVGLVSVVGNVAPEATAAMLRAALAGDVPRATHAAEALAPLVRALFRESNPIPLKAALHLLGLCEAHVRLPLTAAHPTTVEELRQALAHLHEGAESSS
ncbi:MAG: 4-hydroxy-tetrahydrodipicolinate synthase [Planctomycetota bacterium]